MQYKLDKKNINETEVVVLHFWVNHKLRHAIFDTPSPCFFSLHYWQSQNTWPLSYVHDVVYGRPFLNTLGSRHRYKGGLIIGTCTDKFYTDSESDKKVGLVIGTLPITRP